MRGFVNPTPTGMPPPCSCCQFPRAVKKTYNAQPNPTMGVKMVHVFLCSRCDLSPAPRPDHAGA